MSSIKFESNASGTGIFTIASPNSNTNRTLTLPDNTGTILTGSSSITRSQLPAGSVLQVVNATYSSTTSTTSTSFVTSNLTGSITPTSSSNKILILVSLSAYISGPLPASGVFTVYRGTTSGTNLGDATWGFGSVYPATGNVVSVLSCNYLDSPATTSSTTYTVAIKTENASNTFQSSPNGQKSTITLMEIAA